LGFGAKPQLLRLMNAVKDCKKVVNGVDF